MKSSFIIKAWRFGWLRKGALPPQGWRHLLLRLWWRYNLQPEGLPQVSTSPYGLVPASALPQAARAPMHWAADQRGAPYCGEGRGALWTIDMAAVTCPACKRLGFSAVMQWRISNR